VEKSKTGNYSCTAIQRTAAPQNSRLAGPRQLAFAAG
jgi:hypothetical protein